MPSPPIAPETTTDPTSARLPSAFTRNSSTIPFAPVYTYKRAPSREAAASMVPGSVAVAPSCVSAPPVPLRNVLTLLLSAFDA